MPINQVDFGEISKIEGISHCVRLPPHVAERQATAAKQVIKDKLAISADIEIEFYSKSDDRHLGPGSGIVLWAENEDGIRIGSDSLGERGVRAEEVGRRAANLLIREVSAGKAIDSHLADMIIPYLAIATEGSTIGVSEVTSHLTTNLWTIEKILGTELHLEGTLGKSGLLQIHPR
jgi:RNA 3'-phosphate cyclase